jgi:hypothetical protein
MAKPQLHQLLAIEPDTRAKAKNIIEEAQNTFTNKKEHFAGATKTYKADKEGDTDRPDSEVKHLVTTVIEKLQYVADFIIKNLHLMHQKEATNAQAKADLFLEDNDGNVVRTFKDIPVTTLVQWEKAWAEVRVMAQTIPTNDPNVEWKKDESRAGVYKTDPITSRRTKKLEVFEVTVQATDKFPAQVNKRVEDVAVGDWIKVYYSGRYTPLQKSQLLSRIDLVISGIKKARACANKQEVVEVEKVSKDLVNFVIN